MDAEKAATVVASGHHTERVLPGVGLTTSRCIKRGNTTPGHKASLQRHRSALAEGLGCSMLLVANLNFTSGARPASHPQAKITSQ